MVNSRHIISREPTLAWVYPTSLTERLDSATWIETTRKLQELGWKVFLLSKGATAGRQTIRGVETISLASGDVYLLGQLLFHLNVLRFIWRKRHEIDIVLFTQVSGFWLFPLRLFRSFSRRKRPLLVMDTRDLFDSVEGSLRIKIRKSFHTFVFWLADYLADGQTAITTRMAALVKIPQKKLWGIWPSGVDPDIFSSAAEKRSWPTDTDPIRLIYVGMMLEKRHLDILCSALIAANTSGTQLSLTVYGEGPLRSRLEKLAEISNGQIQIEQPVAHEEIPNLLAQSHMGVTSLPDPDDIKYQASSPIKLFEYMAAGLPVLATTNICHTDVVGQGKYAFWAEAAEEAMLKAAMLNIWQQREDLPLLGSEALAAVQDWTWAAAAKKLSDALISGLKRSGKE